jgi:hypothetical protein
MQTKKAKMISIPSRAILAFIATQAWNAAAVETDATWVVQTIATEITKSPFVKIPQPADLAATRSAIRLTSPEFAGDVVWGIVQAKHWGLIDDLKLLWWESPIPNIRVATLAVLIEDPQGDRGYRMANYFRESLKRFEGESLNSRSEELNEALRICREVDRSVRASKFREEKK